MRNTTEKKLIGTVPYSRRQIMLMPDGRELERQMLYLPHDSWEQLRQLCIEQKLSCSRVIALLIRESHNDWCGPDYERHSAPTGDLNS